jgi:hypothetical protein
MKLIKARNQYFRFHDQKGDGNCLYHSIAASSITNIKNHRTLRLDMLCKVQEALDNGNNVVSEIWNKNRHGNSLEDWCFSQQEDRKWGSSLDMEFLSYFHGVNIISISNSSGGRGSLETYRTLRTSVPSGSLNENDPVIFIYHHMYNRPFEVNRVANHWGWLQPVDIQSDFYKDAEIFDLDVHYNAISNNDSSTHLKRKKSSSVQSTITGVPTTGVTGVTKKKKTNNETKQSAKEKKQLVLHDWLKGMQCNNLTVVHMKEQLRIQHEQEAETEKYLKHIGVCTNFSKKDMAAIYSTMQYLVNEVVEVANAEATSKQNLKEVELAKKGNRSEYSWKHRALMACHYFHPKLGNKDPTITAVTFNVNPNTLHGWVSKKDMIPKWKCFALSYTVADVIRNIPEQFKCMDRYSSMRLDDCMDEGFDKYLPKPKVESSSLRIFLCKGIDIRSSQMKVTMNRLDNEKYKYLTTTCKRAHTSTRKPGKYDEAYAWVKEQLEIGWNSGIPLTMSDLRNVIKQQFPTMLDMNANAYNQWVRRAVAKGGFSDRKESVSQKIPPDWREKSRCGARRVRQRFLQENVDYIISSDETFLLFHERYKKVLAKTGCKRVGVARKIDEKNGCTLMVSMEWSSSSLIMPMLIFSGGFGKTLMKKWGKHESSLVLFTENHWQTEETMKIYMHQIRLNFGQLKPGCKVGIIYDKAPSHTNSLLQWVEEQNDTDPNGVKIVVEYVDECLTSIYQPCDVVINSKLKKAIRAIYSTHMCRNHRVAGEKVKISREHLVEFVEEAYLQINQQQKTDSYIKQSFELCGLNPYATDDIVFERHLASLSENSVYAALTAVHTALTLQN